MSELIPLKSQHEMPNGRHKNGLYERLIVEFSVFFDCWLFFNVRENIYLDFPSHLQLTDFFWIVCDLNFITFSVHTSLSISLAIISPKLSLCIVHRNVIVFLNRKSIFETCLVAPYKSLEIEKFDKNHSQSIKIAANFINHEETHNENEW